MSRLLVRGVRKLAAGSMGDLFCPTQLKTGGRKHGLLQSVLVCVFVCLYFCVCVSKCLYFAGFSTQFLLNPAAN